MYLELIGRASKELKFSRETIDTSMSQQPGFYFYYAKLCNELLRQTKLLKIELGGIESRVYVELHQQYDRVTERMHTTWNYRDKEWIKTKKELDKVESQAEGLERVCRAFEHRRDMLVNISATLRAEMNSEIRIRKSNNERI